MVRTANLGLTRALMIGRRLAEKIKYDYVGTSRGYYYSTAGLGFWAWGLRPKVQGLRCRVWVQRTVQRVLR